MLNFIDISKAKDADHAIELCYKVFRNTTFKQEGRPLLQDSVVSVPVGKWIEGRSETFWHLSSMQEGEYFNVLPCQNTDMESVCNRNCINGDLQVCVKGKVRNFCYYRAAQAHWMNAILEQLKDKSPHVNLWEKKDSLSGKLKTYVRYQCGGNDYILLFTFRHKKYELITGYPVFYIESKKGFEKDYKKYIENKNR